MIRTSAVAVVVLTAVLGCSHSASQAPQPAVGSIPVEGKPAAPVVVSAELGADGLARVSVRFEAPGQEVRISARGLDGMQVENREVAGNYTEGARVDFVVPYVAAATGQSHLVVSVAGKFSGAQRVSVATFAAGHMSAEQVGRGGVVVTTDDGERVKLMPAQVHPQFPAQAPTNLLPE